MDGLIAIFLLFFGVMALLCGFLYMERRDRFGMILAFITAAVCFIEYGSRIQS